MTHCSLKTLLIFIFLQDFPSAENIPNKYLVPDTRPTEADLEYYLDRLDRITNHQVEELNVTDGNCIIAHVMMSALLTRTLRDYKHKLEKPHVSLIKQILNKSDHYLTHNAWELRFQQHALSDITLTTNVLANSMETFNTGLLPRYLLRNENMSEFTPYYDDLSIPKEFYAQLTEQYMNRAYPITAADSDRCMTSVNWNTIPSSADMPLRQCKAPKLCFEKIFQKPSITYNLSHRLINEMLYLMAFRCYFRSEREDYENFHSLCAEMYRESIYIARRGFFARDMLLEHMSLCSMGGYEEFHRRHWFLKAASFVDDFGCVKEFTNFTKNRTAALILERGDTAENRRKYKQILAHRLATDCQAHEMAVATVAMGAAVRHAAHHLGLVDER